MVNRQPQQKSKHPLMHMVQTLIQKLVQHPEIYPIKYYKKTSRSKRMSALL
jgi:hypothetical protein